MVSLHDGDEFPAWHHGHLKVQDDEAGLHGLTRREEVERYLAVLGLDHGVAVRFQPGSKQGAGVLVILDHEDRCVGLAHAQKEQTGLTDHESLKQSASRHGSYLWQQGFTVKQVVHDYGDLCQVVTELAVEQNAQITTEEFRTLNLCLDDAIAGAVDEYARQREGTIRDEGSERLGVLAHELRNLLNTAILSFESIKTGVVAVNGSTGLMHGRSLLGLRNLIDRSLADVRLDVGMQNIERVAVAEVIEEVEITASVQAQAKEIHFTTKLGEPTVIVEADRQILTAAIANLVQNAFKFTPKRGKVSLTTSTTTQRVLIEVDDECGGLLPGKAEELFHHSQRGGDRTGLGLGLSICLKTVKAIHGELRVRDIPGKGCVFTIDLPKQRSSPLLLHLLVAANPRPIVPHRNRQTGTTKRRSTHPKHAPSEGLRGFYGM